MLSVEGSGTFRIGGELEVHRMGFGAMRLVGPAWAFGEPADPDNATRVLKRAVELGVDFIDTADSYGPFLNERQIAAGLSPYAKGLVIATKGASIRFAEASRIEINSAPFHLREALEGSLRRLKLDCIDLYQVHRLDGVTPVEETVGALDDLRRQGKLRHIGLSEVGLEELKRAHAVTPIATVQNRYNILERGHEDVLKFCEAEGIGFIPWFPLGAGKLTGAAAKFADAADRLGVKSSQLALAWLLAHSPVMLLIPGTSSIAHLEENVGAAALNLSSSDKAALDALGQGNAG